MILYLESNFEGSIQIIDFEDYYLTTATKIKKSCQEKSQQD
jgi:hypothetical protein